MIPMTPKELETIMIAIYGRKYGSIPKLSADIGASRVTISRWLNGSPIGMPEAIAIRLLYCYRKHKLHFKGLISPVVL